MSGLPSPVKSPIAPLLAVGDSLLAIEAARTIVLDASEVIDLADRRGPVIPAVNAETIHHNAQSCQ